MSLTHNLTQIGTGQGGTAGESPSGFGAFLEKNCPETTENSGKKSSTLS